MKRFSWMMIVHLMPVIAIAATPVLQIATSLQDMKGQPQWTLILRDMDSGRIAPLILDIKNKNNSWTFAAPGHNYRVTSSHLDFGVAGGEIDDFCHLQHGSLIGKSLNIMVSGHLIPNRHAYRCHVLKYKN